MFGLYSLEEAPNLLESHGLDCIDRQTFREMEIGTNDEILSPARDKVPRKGKSKVKSGCRTCKVRKVKCDEGRPACRKCESTGRTCDGYGIWGGGSKVTTPHVGGRFGMKGNPFPLLGDAAGDYEHCTFEWFRCRTVKKLPGAFESYFWDTLVMGACFNEPAVMHAVLALGSVHKHESAIYGFRPTTAPTIPDEEERFTLRHYSKAIRQLQPHFQTKTKESIRVALISCMIFTCLEFMRGHYRTGNEHLKNGMRLVGGLFDAEPGTEQNLIDLNIDRPLADDWLLECFSKINLHAVLLGQGTWGLYRPTLHFDSQPLPVIFKGMTQARKRLDWLMMDAYEAADKWKRATYKDPDLKPTAEQLNKQERRRNTLEIWLRIYKVSRVSLLAQTGYAGPLAYQLLFVYCHMVRIMNEACFRPKGESTFDDFTSDFVGIVDETLVLAREAQRASLGKVAFEQGKLTPFISDRVAVPPLFFAALHCRIPAVRHQAIKLIYTMESKEGIWDSLLVGACAREVLRLEEINLPEGLKTENRTKSFDGPLSKMELEKPDIPEPARIQDVQLDLPDGPDDKMTMTCKRKNDDGTWEIFSRVYDLPSQTWCSG